MENPVDGWERVKKSGVGSEMSTCDASFGVTCSGQETDFVNYLNPCLEPHSSEAAAEQIGLTQ